MKAHSAGSAPSGRINPFAIEALHNAGIDTSGYRSKSRDEFAAAGGVNLPVGLLIWVIIIPMLLKADFGALAEERWWAC